MHQSKSQRGLNSLKKDKIKVPDDWIACERALQAAEDKLEFSMYSDWKIFSSIGQNIPRSTRIESSKARPFDLCVARWLKTVPILKQKHPNQLSSKLCWN